MPLDSTAIQLVTLTNVICVIFVTHAYETVFLIKEREDDQVIHRAVIFAGLRLGDFELEVAGDRWLEFGLGHVKP